MVELKQDNPPAVNRKRHTARDLTYPSAIQFQRGGGTPNQSLGYPPERDMGPVEVLWDRDGVHPREQTDTCENSTFHISKDTGSND